MERLALDGTGAADASLLFAPAGKSAHAGLLVMPGGRCAAHRYGWLGDLALRGVHVFILDGFLSNPDLSLMGEGPSPAILQLATACALIAGHGLPIHAVGHSAGAAALLDALDPASNAMARLPADFRLPVSLASVTSLGCSLQPRTLDMVLPHRSEDSALSCPLGTRLLFVAGDDDAIAPPALVGRTAARYTTPVSLMILPEATHYGWAGPREPGDDPRFDLVPERDTQPQRSRTLDLLAAQIG